MIESADVRGHIVHLDDTWTDARARTDYPPTVETVLGEAFAAATLLASTIKFAGKMTLQVRGDGPVHLLVVQVSSDYSVRGLARWSSVPEDTSTQAAFGTDARMSIIIEADEKSEPYQGIVVLSGNTFADALRDYFVQSEQLATELILSVNGDTAAGLLLQRLPGKPEDEDGWGRACELANTLKPAELLELDPQTVLHRLYHEEQVRLFEPGTVRFRCSCSAERTDNLIISLGVAEAESILADEGAIEITCEFCDAEYRYDSVDVAALFRPGVTANAGDDAPTLH